MKKWSRILAPTNFSRSSKEGLGYAISLAEETRAELIILHVAGPMGQRRSRPDEWPLYNMEVPIRAVERLAQLMEAWRLLPSVSDRKDDQAIRSNGLLRLKAIRPLEPDFVVTGEEE